MYVGNLSYDVKYRDLIEFMRGGGWGRFSGLLVAFLVVVVPVMVVVRQVVVRIGIGPLEVRGFGDGVKARGQMASSVTPRRTRHSDVPWRSRVWAWAIKWGEMQFPFSVFEGP